MNGGRWQRTANIINKIFLNEFPEPSPILAVPEPINYDIYDSESVADAPPLKERNVKHHRQLPTTLAAFLLPEDIIPSHSLKGIFQKAEELINETGAITKAASAELKMRIIKSPYYQKPHIVQPKDKSKYFYECDCRLCN